MLDHRTPVTRRRREFDCAFDISSTNVSIDGLFGPAVRCAAATLDEAANYWISQKANLVGQENYVVINIGNEPIGNTNPGQRTAAQTVLNADTAKNTVLSIHMYAVFNTAANITNYLNTFQANNWPLVIGELGWQFNSGSTNSVPTLSCTAT